jgi:16S rRNA processing protein RimM
VLLEIGYVGRPHGLRGDVVVRLVTTDAERLAPGTTVECRDGEMVVESARPLPGKTGARGSHWLVRFAGIGSREAAEALTGAKLRAEPRAGGDGLWVHQLIGSQVVDVGGQDHGTVVAVEANPASDLLVLDRGGLVPLRFVVTTAPGRITVDVPAGLFEL